MPVPSRLFTERCIDIFSIDYPYSVAVVVNPSAQEVPVLRLPEPPERGVIEGDNLNALVVLSEDMDQGPMILDPGDLQGLPSLAPHPHSAPWLRSAPSPRDRDSLSTP